MEILAIAPLGWSVFLAPLLIGFAFGFISYPTIKLLTGRGREVKPLLYVLAPLSVFDYIFFQS